MGIILGVAFVCFYGVICASSPLIEFNLIPSVTFLLLGLFSDSIKQGE
jgi:hypothetical protein